MRKPESHLGPYLRHHPRARKIRRVVEDHQVQAVRLYCFQDITGWAPKKCWIHNPQCLPGIEDPGPNGSLSTSSIGAYLDSSSLTGLVPFQEFDLFKYTWSADGSGTYGGNSYMVTNQSRFFYIDVSPLNGHPAIVVGQRQQ